MSLNYVTLTCDLFDGTGSRLNGGTATFAPSVQLTDATDHEIITQAPVQVSFRPAGSPAVSLLATDNANVAPSGWAWTVTFSGVPGSPAPFSFFLPFAGGASQNLSAISPVSTAVTQFPSWPGTALGDTVYGGASPAGVPVRLAGPASAVKQFLTSTGTGSAASAPAWGAIAPGDLPAATAGTQGAVTLGALGTAPADQGLLGWAYDPVVAANASNQPAAGTLIAVRVKVPACTISFLWVGINSSGSGLTAGQNFAGLYSGDGTTLLSATADQSSAWTSGFTSIKMPLTAAQAVAAGWVYVAWYANGTTIPKFQWNGAANLINANLANATARFAHAGAGLTTALPSSLTLATNGDSYWTAVSLWP